MQHLDANQQARWFWLHSLKGVFFSRCHRASCFYKWSPFFFFNLTPPSERSAIIILTHSESDLLFLEKWNNPVNNGLFFFVWFFEGGNRRNPLFPKAPQNYTLMAPHSRAHRIHLVLASSLGEKQQDPEVVSLCSTHQKLLGFFSAVKVGVIKLLYHLQQKKNKWFEPWSRIFCCFGELRMFST